MEAWEHGNVSRGRTGRIRVTVGTVAVLNVNPEDALDPKFMEALRVLVAPLVEAEDKNCDVCQGDENERIRKSQGCED